ncbi:endonuclease/exonuclease/phosphatase family protein [Salininema proteolyticum]|uniref:Endonuclease/exonuclease/phosphatase family protein n=1 Tax=Salininema proteolyticum TaxID=1607685 RepID=A0ABV8TUP1_9ACTN
MTFNLRRSVPFAYVREWPRLRRQWWWRSRLVRRLIAAERPDILALQEARPRQVRSLARAFPDYAVAVKPRSHRRNDEAVPVLWLKNRFSGGRPRFAWLSDTPTVVGSRTWGNRLPRMTTEVPLTDRSTGRALLVVNTHLDNGSVPARRRSADAIAATARRADTPVVVTGDFNCGPDSAPHEVVTRGRLEDSWDTAKIRLTPEWRTHNGWRPEPTEEGARIDWILVSGDAAVEKAGVNTYAQGKDTPSDHWAVQALITLRPNGQRRTLLPDGDVRAAQFTYEPPIMEECPPPA